ncbi:hypothetical protein Taro_012733 [Colocasia esculenta]|uniref:Uncharacterized protein n=1 Tax=Colocasia esculenta TaxID=4460 RepID=A0A843U9X8_COLES|nr:hypothetical protein [Colocasia esculenta]
MARVISSCSSSISYVTSPFTTLVALGGSSSAALTMTLAQFKEIINETVSQNISHIVSQTVSQTLAQLGFLGDRAPLAQQPLGRVEELLVAEELWNDHKKPFFFPFSSAATCTNHPLEVDQRARRVSKGSNLAPMTASHRYTVNHGSVD